MATVAAPRSMELSIPEDIDENVLLQSLAKILQRKPGLWQRLLTRISSPIEFEDSITLSIDELMESGGITLLLGTEWQTPHVHCRAGPQAPWTPSPGLALQATWPEGFKPPKNSHKATWFAIRFPSAEQLEFVFNNGGNHWQKASDGGNYRVYTSGVWVALGSRCQSYADMVIRESQVAQPEVVPVQPVTSSVSPLAEMEQTEGGVALVYHTDFRKPCLHCRLDPALAWTNPPGLPLSPSGLPGFPPRLPHERHGWWVISIPEAKWLEFVPNEDCRRWDKAQHGGNYVITRPGVWKLCAGALEKLSAAEASFEAIAASAELCDVASVAEVVVATPMVKQLEPAATPTDFQAPAGGIAEVLKSAGLTVLYRCAWANPHLHCRSTAEHEWTTTPGIPITLANSSLVADLELTAFGDSGGASDRGSWYAIQTNALETLEFVVNDGGPHYRWDKPSGGGNYCLTKAGTWLVKTGRCELLEPPPPAPDAATVTAVSRSSVTLAWSAVPGRLRGYRIIRDGKRIGSVSSGVLQYVDSGVVAAREFNYQLVALSHQGLESAAGPKVLAKTEPPGPPGKPTGLRCSAASGTSVVVEWGIPQETGGAPVTAYRVLRNDKHVATVLSTDDTAKASYRDENVTKGEVYKYTVVAAHLPREKKLRDDIMHKRQRMLCPEEHDPLASVTSSNDDSINEGPPAGPLEVEAANDLEPEPCEEDIVEQLKQRGITIFQKSDWDQSYMHCQARAQMGWTPAPGLEMQASPATALPASEGWKVLFLPHARTLELVLNDGKGKWDKAPGGRNFTVDVPGAYRLANGQLERLASPPAAPKAFKGEASDGSRVQLVWQPPPVVGETSVPIVRYKILRNGIVVGTVDHTPNAEAEGVFFEDKNLFAHTNYEYAVAAVNRQEMTGVLTDPITVMTQLPGPPSEPQKLRGVAQKVGETLVISLEWEPPEDCGGAPVVSYNILRDGEVVGAYQVTTEQLQNETGAAKPMEATMKSGYRWVRSTRSYSNLAWFKDSLSWTDTGVQPGATYAYQVTAVQLGNKRADELRAFRRCGSAFLDSLNMDVEGPPCEPVVIRAAPLLDAPMIGETSHRVIFQGFDWGSYKVPNWWSVLHELLPEFRSAGVNMLWLPPVSDSVDHHGYLPRQWYNLDSHYGTTEDLQRLVVAMHEQGIVPMLDVVVNHRCASKQDSAGRWLKFEQPDWGDWAVCCNSPAIQGTGRPVTGEEAAQYAPCVDHTNGKVQQDVRDYLRYMMDEVGFRALRFDFVKGYAPHFQVEYVKSVGAPFAVAENWNGGTDGLHHYVQQCQGKMAVFDFPLYYVLKRCVHANHFCDLVENGRPCGILGRDPARACTFVENHDTSQLAIVGGAFGNNDQVLRGYAYILTHPGVPTIFYGDYARSAYVRERILELCALRRDAGVHSTSRVDIRRADGGLYAAIVHNSLAVKIGTNDWNPGPDWRIASLGPEFAVWVRK